MSLRIMIFTILAALTIAPAAPARGAPAPLVNAELVTLEGQPVPGGCQYELSTTVHPGQPAVEQHELSEDTATCTMLLESGTPADAGSDRAGANLASVTVDETATAPSTSAGALTDASTTTTHSAGYHRTWVEDPCDPGPCIVVNVVENSIDWYWDNPYITPSSIVRCAAEYDWAWQTGWGLHENDIQCLLNQPEYPTSWADSTSYVHYKNGLFCFVTDTHVYYDRNHAYGEGTGDLVGVSVVRKSGFCQGLLTIHSRTERTMN